MNGKTTWCALAACLLNLGPVSASTVTDRVDLTTLTQRAEGVYLATVASVSARAVDSSRLESLVTLHIQQRYIDLADASEMTTVVCAGGTLGERVDHVSGAPSFHPGERVLVFLEREPSGAWVVVDDAMGKMVVLRDPASGQELVRAQGSFKDLDQRPSAPNAERRPRAPDTLPLSDVLRYVLGRPEP